MAGWFFDEILFWFLGQLRERYLRWRTRSWTPITGVIEQVFVDQHARYPAVEISYSYCVGEIELQGVVRKGFLKLDAAEDLARALQKGSLVALFYDPVHASRSRLRISD